MCEMKTVLVSICLILLVRASFCMYCLYVDKNMGQYSEIKIQKPCENEYKKYCLNGAECYYLMVEDTVGCKCTWLNRKRFNCFFKTSLVVIFPF